MTNSIAAGMSAGGALGAAAGWFGSSVLGALRRGVRPPPRCCGIAVAVLWALVGARVGAGALPVWWAPVPLLLAWGGVLLGACDLLVRRLPDALTLPAYPVLFASVGLAAICGGSAGPVLSALLGAGAFGGIYLLVRVVAPHSLGAGDVKLAGLLGAAVGPVSPVAVPLSVMVSAVLALLQSGISRGGFLRSGSLRGGPAQSGPSLGGSSLGGPSPGGPAQGGPWESRPSRGWPSRRGPSRSGPVRNRLRHRSRRPRATAVPHAPAMLIPAWSLTALGPPQPG